MYYRGYESWDLRASASPRGHLNCKEGSRLRGPSFFLSTTADEPLLRASPDVTDQCPPRGVFVGICGVFVGKAPQIVPLTSIYCVRPEGFEPPAY
jgi:hypothetical protein